MDEISRLLDIAVEDNVAWCSRVCSVHGSSERTSAAAWANMAISPPFYPNIITRRKGVQDEADDLIREVRKANTSRNWGIKDSFGDLALADQGFDLLLAGHWYGGTVSSRETVGWRTVASPNELCLWERAWGCRDDIIFPARLLDDQRITFWFKGEPGAIEAGFISFDTGFSLGLSNWFCLEDDRFGQMGVLQAAGSVSHGLPVVCWSKDDLGLEATGLVELGPLQIWISR